MGYDLIPRNKKVEPIYFGAFTWPIILQKTGAGYIIGYGEGRVVSAYVYRPRRKASPVSNDGYPISSTEAKSMALCCRGYLSVQRFVNKEWADMQPEQKESCLEYNKTENIYREEVNESFLVNIEKFADFCEKSGGFKID